MLTVDCNFRLTKKLIVIIVFQYFCSSCVNGGVMYDTSFGNITSFYETFYRVKYVWQDSPLK